jgi:hypothetical protein
MPRFLRGLAVPLMSSPVSAQQAEPLVVTAENLMAGDEHHQTRPDPNELLPGDVVLFRLIFTNTTNVQVRNVEFKASLLGVSDIQ